MRYDDGCIIDIIEKSHAPMNISLKCVFLNILIHALNDSDCFEICIASNLCCEVNFSKP